MQLGKVDPELFTLILLMLSVQQEMFNQVQLIAFSKIFRQGPVPGQSSPNAARYLDLIQVLRESTNSRAPRTDPADEVAC